MQAEIHNDQIDRDVLEVSLTGQMLFENPLLNKGSSFPEDERREFHLLGLLPPHVAPLEVQLARTYENYRRKDDDLERYIFLASLFLNFLAWHFSFQHAVIAGVLCSALSALGVMRMMGMTIPTILTMTEIVMPIQACQNGSCSISTTEARITIVCKNMLDAPSSSVFHRNFCS